MGGPQSKETPFGEGAAEGDYSYEVAEPSLCIRDIKQMHNSVRDHVLKLDNNL